MLNIQTAQDEQVDPISGELFQADWRLLDKQTWMKRPELIRQLLNEAAALRPLSGLPALATSYLAITKNWCDTSSSVPQNIDYFLVLGNALNGDATPTPELLARLDLALLISQTRPVARLLLSGGGRTAGVTESELMNKWLTDRGVSPARILTESQSMDTVENIVFSAALLNQQKASQVCLITGVQGAWRESCLLPVHLQHTDSAITALHVCPKHAISKICAQQTDLSEQFLLFKDMGRILKIWTYRDWTQQAA